MARKKLKITIKHPGALTRKAKASGMSPRAFANKVMAAPKGRYTAQTRRQANFAKVAATWNHKGASKARTTRRRRK
jgi:hypothetical protein